MLLEDMRCVGDPVRFPVMRIIDLEPGRQDGSLRGCAEEEVQRVFTGPFEPVLYFECAGEDADDVWKCLTSSPMGQFRVI
jgi:hypothetical protein